MTSRAMAGRRAEATETGRRSRVRYAAGRRCRVGIGLATLLGGLGAADRASAAEWWVDANAPAGGTGSQASPFQTINAARDVMVTGDTVWVSSGTYNETVDFYILPAGVDAPTTIRAVDGATPVIVGDGSAEFVLQAGETPKMVFQGLTINNGGSGVGIEFYQADDGEVRECTIQNADAGGIEFYYASRGFVYRSDIAGGVSGKRSAGTTIQECRVHDSGAEGITLHDDSSDLKYLNNIVYDNYHVNIYIDSAHDVVVDGNLVFWNGTVQSDFSGILLADEAYDDLDHPVLQNIVITNNIIVNADSGIEFWDGEFPGSSGLKNVLIANNTIINSATLGIVWAPGQHDSSFVRNNIFAQQQGVGVLLLNAKSIGGVTLDHNLWFMPGVTEPFNWGGGEVFTHDGWVTASGQGTGDVLADPAFVGSSWDLDAPSYKLPQTSPAVDTGVSIDGLTIDFDRGLRPAGNGYDIGAYEYGAVPNPDGGPPEPPDGGPGGSGQGGTGQGNSGQGGNGQGANGQGASASSDGATDEEGGCGCRTPGSAGAVVGAPALGALGVLLLGRARRRRKA